MPAADLAVEARGVHKLYGALHVLRGIDLEVRRGEVVVVVGPSGSGKSTFLRCLNHLEAIQQGSIRVCGDLVGADARAWELDHRPDPALLLAFLGGDAERELA